MIDKEKLVKYLLAEKKECEDGVIALQGHGLYKLKLMDDCEEIISDVINIYTTNAFIGAVNLLIKKVEEGEFDKEGIQ